MEIEGCVCFEMAAFDEDAFKRRLEVSQVRWGRVRWFDTPTLLDESKYINLSELSL